MLVVGALTPIVVIIWAAYEAHYKPYKKGQHHE